MWQRTGHAATTAQRQHSIRFSAPTLRPERDVVQKRRRCLSTNAAGWSIPSEFSTPAAGHTSAGVSGSLASGQRHYSRSPSGQSAFGSTGSAPRINEGQISSNAGLLQTRRSSSSAQVYPSRSYHFRDPGGMASARRQKLTKRELSAFDDMFSLIFSTATQMDSHWKPESSSVEGDELEELDFERLPVPMASPTIQLSSMNTMSAMFSKLKSKPKGKIRWIKTEDVILDAKKEEIALCGSDRELLTWTMRVLFQEQVPTPTSVSGSVQEGDGMQDGQVPVNTPVPLSPPNNTPMEVLPQSCYPHLLALLMRTFRTKFNNPHISLALFHHAKNLSVASYVTCCGTEAYNELIEARWLCFRDLRGVHDALEEMSNNKVLVDGGTRRLIDKLRRDVGARTMWAEAEFIEGQEDGMRLLQKIETMGWKDIKGVGEPAPLPEPSFDNAPKAARPHKKPWTATDESWKIPIPVEPRQDFLSFV